MKAFRWPLERLLEVSHLRETMLQGELLRRSQQVAVAHQEILSRQLMIRELLAEVRSQSTEPRIHAQRLMLGSVDAEMELARRLHDRLDQAETAQSRTRKDLVEQRRNRRKLQRLREQARRAWHREIQRDEQKHLHEVGQVAFVRRRIDRDRGYNAGNESC